MFRASNGANSGLSITDAISLIVAPLFQCHRLPPSSAWPTAFNNTAVQVLKIKPDVKSAASRAVVTLSSQNSSTRLPLPPGQSASGASRPPEDGDKSDSGKEATATARAHKSKADRRGDETIEPAHNVSFAGPESDSEETDGGMVPMDAYMAIFDEAPLVPWRTSASASKSAVGPGKPPQAPQSSVSTLQQESPMT